MKFLRSFIAVLLVAVGAQAAEKSGRLDGTIVGRDATAFAEADRAVAGSRSRFVQAAAVLTYVMGHRYEEALQRIEAILLLRQ